MGITIKQIAEMVGVSRGTVDRALHGREGVNPETKAKIEEVIRKTGYRPNTVAKALKAAENPIVFGIMVPYGRFYEEVLNGIRKAEESYAPYGVRIKIMERSPLERDAQLKSLELFEEMQPDGIILAAVDEPEVCTAVNRMAKSIPIITYNSDLTGADRLCFVGQDHFAAGRTAGTLMGKMIPPGTDIAVILGSKNMLAHIQRADGFQAALREQGNFQVLQELYETHESDVEAYELITKLLKTHKNLAGICLTGAGQAGAGRALAESGRAGEVRFACYDTMPETVGYIRDGVVDFTIVQDPFLQGYLPVKIMYEYLAFGIQPKKEKLFTRIDIRVKDNLDDAGYEIFTGANQSIGEEKQWKIRQENVL